MHSAKSIVFIFALLIFTSWLVIQGCTITASDDDDSATVDEEVTCSDNDADGYGLNCSLGPDCDDNDPSVHLDCIEDIVCNDFDGDGYGNGCEAGPDCDDFDSDYNIDCSMRNCIDNDGDGYGWACPLGPDCNDYDPDQNTDCDPPETTCYDDDGDGYGVGCDAGPDCDDYDPNQNTVCDCVDNDGDGFYASGCARALFIDCDDSDFQISPWRTDTPYDGIDQNCDGIDICQNDSDGDGYGFGPGCLNLDCDDTNPDIYFAASVTDLVGDFIDSNCDGVDGQRLPIDWVDSDGDGVSPVDGDCDDTDPAVAPDLQEIIDGVDNDCDGVVDEPNFPLAVTDEVLDYDFCLDPVAVGDYIYCADGERLLVFNIADTSSPFIVNRIPTESTLSLIGAKSNYLFAQAYNPKRLISMALTDPSNPVIDDSIELIDSCPPYSFYPGANSKSFVLEGDHIYLYNSGSYDTDYSAALESVSILDPSNLVYEGYEILTDYYSYAGLVAAAGHLYLFSHFMQDDNVVNIFRLEGETIPVFAGSFDLGHRPAYRQVGGDSNILAIVELGAESSLHIYSLTDPVSPVLETTIDIGKQIIDSPVLSDGVLYYITSEVELDDRNLLSVYSFPENYESKLHMVDLSTIDSPTELSSVTGSAIRPVILDSPRLIYSINFPLGSSASLIDFTIEDYPAVSDFPSTYYFRSVLSAQEEMLMFNNLTGVEYYDFSSVTSPVLSFKSDNSPNSFSYWKSAWNGSTLARIKINIDPEIGISDSRIILYQDLGTGLEKVGETTPVENLIQFVDLDEDLLIFSTQENLFIYSIANPANPILEHTMRESDIDRHGSNIFSKVALHSPYLYIMESYTLITLDLSNPSSPQAVSALNLPHAGGNRFIVNGSEIMVWTESDYSWIYFIDASNPGALQLASKIFLPATNLCYNQPPINASMRGDIVLLPELDRASIIDISDLYNPVHTGSLSAPGQISWAGTIGDSYVVLADGHIYVKEQ